MSAARLVKPATVRANAARLRDAAARHSRVRGVCNKVDFLAAARNALRHVHALLGGDGVVRVNRGGPAVSGEATLHTNYVYVCLYVSPFGDASRFYYRRVNGRGGHAGSGNLWHSYRAFSTDPDGLIDEHCRLAPRPGTVVALLHDPDYFALTLAARVDATAGGAALDYVEECLAAPEWEHFRGLACDAPRMGEPT